MIDEYPALRLDVEQVPTRRGSGRRHFRSVTRSRRTADVLGVLFIGRDDNGPVLGVAKSVQNEIVLKDSEALGVDGDSAA
jgi:hypothetical protein